MPPFRKYSSSLTVSIRHRVWNFSVDPSARVEIVSALWAPTWLGSRRMSDWAIAEQDASACAALFLPDERP